MRSPRCEPPQAPKPPLPRAAQTVQFGLDGVTYEIDLSDDNAAALRDELARYIGAGRRVGGRKVRAVRGRSIPAVA